MSLSPYDSFDRNCWVDIDLAALKDNFRILQAMAGVPAMAVVKANAYGHGMVPVARAALDAGAVYLGVGTVAEACLLRENGIDAPVMMVSPFGISEIATLVERGVTFHVWYADMLMTAQREAAAQGRVATVHLKFDTGMGRIGFLPEQVDDVVQTMSACPDVSVEGVMSHFHSADEDDRRETELQIERFNAVLAALRARGVAPRYIHHANSAGLIRHGEARFNMVRTGIALYGLNPAAGFPVPEGIRPVLSWQARMVSVKRLPAGHAVSYGATYRTQGAETIAVLPFGYADGFRRNPPVAGHVLFGGHRLPVVGRVCMDQIMVRVPDGVNAAAGDAVTIIGHEGGLARTALDWALEWNTITYDVATGISPRIPRRYKD